jgi:hypothetical protein
MLQGACTDCNNESKPITIVYMGTVATQSECVGGAPIKKTNYTVATCARLQQQI